MTSAGSASISLQYKLQALAPDVDIAASAQSVEQFGHVSVLRVTGVVLG
jgi:hypothetical protein